MAFDPNKFRRTATATDDAAKKVEEKRKEPKGLTVPPEKLPEGGNTRDVPDAPSTPTEPATTSATRRDPNKPPDSRSYQTGTPASGRGGAKGGAEAATPAPEVVEEKVSVTENVAPLSPEDRLAQAEKMRADALAEIAEMKRLREADTPESRRAATAEAMVAERMPGAASTVAQELLNLPAYIPAIMTQPFGGPEFAGPGKTQREAARQSTGGFIQEVRPPEEPRLRSTGEIITPAMSIERLTTRIGERKKQRLDLQKKVHDRGKVEQSLPRMSAPRLVAEAERKSIQSEMNQIQKEIDALIKLRKEIQQSAAGDVAE